MFIIGDDGSHKINSEYIKFLVEGVVKDAAMYPEQAAEGKRLSDQFRKSFPDVSDKDLGSIIMIFSHLMLYICESYPFYNMAQALESAALIYAHSGADLLKIVLDLGEL